MNECNHSLSLSRAPSTSGGGTATGGDRVVRRHACRAPAYGIVVEKIQRKSRVREWAPQKAPRIRAGVTKKDQKAELKYLLKKNQTHRCYAEKTSIFFPDDRQTPARREARNHRSEDAKMLGPPPCGPQRTGRAD